MTDHIVRSSADFHLPDEILSVIPTDPYDQLDIARKITSMAIASRVSKLELETSRLRQNVGEKDHAIHELQKKLVELDKMFQDANTRLQAALEENVKLSNERQVMVTTMQKMNRDLAKLETFKRQVMQSLNDDNSPTQTVDIGTCDQEVAKSFPKDGFPNGSHGRASSCAAKVDAHQEASKQADLRLSPYITPRFTPPATPKVISTNGSPRGYPDAKHVSGTTSPSKSFEAQGTFPTGYPSSTQSSAPGSPPHGRTMPTRTPRIDGKEFFRQARNRLSYEQFGAFLANIKELNAHRQSREEMLRKSEEIFGIENRDLYQSFKALLNRSKA